MEETRRLVEQLGLGDRVKFTGWLQAERKRATLTGATVFVLPSYVEGMPMALLEAMSFGLPVIATPVGGVPEMCHARSSDGLLRCPRRRRCAGGGDRPTDEASAELRERLGRAARETVAKRFSLDSAVERLLGIYRRFGIEPRQARPKEQVPLGAVVGGR